MKRLISPPINAVLLTFTLFLLIITGWRLWLLKTQAEQDTKAENVNVQIPDSTALAIPPLTAYVSMVDTPLFWDSRKAYVPPAPATPTIQAETPPPPPVDTTLPEGRLIGIIDLGSKLFAVMQNTAGNSVRLHQGDSWGAWKVSGIDPDKVILTLGENRHEIPLIGDFSAPQQSPQVAQAKAAQQAQAQQQQLQKQAQQQRAVSAASPEQPPANMAAVPTESRPAPPNAGLPYPAETAKQPPALSVKEALEARQRLMASRWGALVGDDQNQPPINTPAH